jgi:hypothetical protein
MIISLLPDDSVKIQILSVHRQPDLNVSCEQIDAAKIRHIPEQRVLLAESFEIVEWQRT